MLRKSVVILTMLLCSVATQVHALGLGTVTVESALNQPLRVRIEILQLGNTRLQDITVAMASLEDFQRFEIDRPSFLSNVRFNVAAAPDGDFITLTSNQVVREPYLNFILDTRWPNGRLLSEHTILLDLPVFDNQQPSSAVRQPISPALRVPTQPTVRPTTPAPAPVVSAPVTAPAVAPTPAVEPTQAEPEVVQAPPAAVEQTAAPATPEPAAPPVPDPEPVVDNTPVQANAEPGTITTSPNETLSDIALRIRPDNSVSMQQTMLAIQRLNPDAFIGDNINRMRAGQILRVPGLQEIQTLDAREAAAEVSRQNQAFAVVDVQPLAAPATNTQTPSQAPQGQLSVVTSDADAVDAAGGAGQVNEVENAVLDQRISELENQLAQRQEEVDRARIQREEMNARLLELEDQIAAATEIIRLQDLQLAQLQSSLAQAAAQQAAIAAAEAQAADQAGQRTGVVDDVLRILTGNLLFIGFGLALVVLLVVVLLLRRNRADDEEDLDELDEGEFAAIADRDERNDRDDRYSRARPDQEFRDYDDSDLDDELDQIIGMGEGGDAVSQAAALLRQGKTVRAVSLLQMAVNEEPDDQDLRMKLLEALAEQGDLSAFEEQADMLDGNPDIISRVNELRDSIEFEELEVPEPIPAPAPKPEPEPEPEPEPKSRSTLFASKQTTEEEDRLGAASFLDDLGIDLDAFDDDDEEASVAAEKPAAEPAPEPKPAATVKKASAPSLDDDSFHADDMDLTFDLAGDGDGEDSSAAKSSSDDADDTADDAEGVFSFDGEEDEDTASAADATSLEFELGEPEVESSATPAAAAAPKADSDIESFEFDVDSTPTPAEAAPEPELDLETFAFDTDPIASEQEDTVSGPEAVSATDEQSIDFEFDKTEIQPAKVETSSEEMETFEFDVDEDPDATVVEKPAEDDDLDLDFEEFDLDDEDTTTVVESKAGNDEDDDDFLDLDAIEDEVDNKGSEIELDLEAADPEEIADSDDAEEDLDYLSEDDEVELESVDDVEEVEMLSSDDEAATKLELAYAYRKMGDIEGAREILQEVVKEGTQAQVKEANKLMTSLDDAKD